jgi:hypothetical protein
MHPLVPSSVLARGKPGLNLLPATLEHPRAAPLDVVYSSSPCGYRTTPLGNLRCMCQVSRSVSR